MMSPSWLKTLFARLTGRPRCRPIRNSVRLQLESLEDRTVPSGSSALAAYGDLPLAFESNQGQTAEQVDFLARGSGYTLALTPSSAILALQNGTGSDVLQLQFVGANPSAQVTGQNELITRTNYLTGNDPSQWTTGIANYGKVEYQDVYAGIDLVYYGNQGQLEYDFVVDPGIDPSVIAISIQGARDVTLDTSGNLVLHTSGGDVVQQAPVIYQELGGVRQAVAGEFVLQGDTEVGFRIGTYDTSRTLIIDPVLSYSTYLGGNSSDSGQAIAVDADGNAYITGYTYSANFPTTAGATQPGLGGAIDAFVAKLNASGTQLLYSTYLGGTSDDEGLGIAVDAAGNAYVTGYTGSSNFPVSADAFQRTNPSGWFKGFVAKLNSTGSALLYSTYLGGSGGFDSSRAIAVDGAGNAYITGDTSSADFPTQNPLQSVHADNFAGSTSGYSDAFVTKLNASGTALVYSTFLGGSADDSGRAIAVDAAGNAYVTGSAHTYPTDPSLGLIAFPTTPGAYQTTNATSWGNTVPFVTKVNAAGSALAYSTFLGGTTGSNDWASGIDVDAAGNAYVTGTTQAADFPTTPDAAQRTRGGLSDAFVTALNPNGSALVYSTFLGGSNTDHGMGIAVDATGNAHIVGITESTNFPASANAVQQTIGGMYDAFITKVNATGSALLHSTYLGGSGDDFGVGIALDAAGNAYVAGETASTNFPTTANAPQPIKGAGYDAFVAKLDLSEPPFTLSINDVTVAEGNSGTRLAVFTVTRSGDTSAAVSVGYATANGTAAAGSDYQATSGTLTFAPGETSRTISVVIIGDRLAEPNETFFVNLSQTTSGAVVDGQGAGTIVDDEPRVSISDVTRTEGKRGQTTLFTFTVTLSVAYDQAVTMSFRTVNNTAKTNDSDYVARTGTLTFAPGETTKTITIEVKGDNKKESDETFFLDLFGNSSNSLFSKSRGTGTILNDDF